MVFGCKLHFIFLFYNYLRYFLRLFSIILFHFVTLKQFMLFLCKLPKFVMTATAKVYFAEKNKISFYGKIIDGFDGNAVYI